MPFRIPIGGLAPLAPLDLTRCGRLDFETPDTARFPCLSLAFRALAGEAGLPVVLNAANEVAVASFLDRRLRFTAIPEVIARTMDEYRASRSAARFVISMTFVSSNAGRRSTRTGRLAEVQ